MIGDRNGLDILDRETCLSLLAGAGTGRVGLTMDALPVVLPVNFAIDGERAVIRTIEGSRLALALESAVVALEADHVDGLSHSGWSVLTQGLARVVADPAELEGLRSLPLRAWANDAADRFVSVDLTIVSGRRLRPWSTPSPLTRPRPSSG